MSRLKTSPNGPKFYWSRSVQGFECFIGPGPVRKLIVSIRTVPSVFKNIWFLSGLVLEFGKTYMVLVRVGPTFLQFSRPWSELVLVFLGLGLGSGPVLDFFRSWVVQFWPVDICWKYLEIF